MPYLAIALALTVGFGAGYVSGRPAWEAPTLSGEGHMGGFIKTLPSATYDAVTLAGEYCKRWPADLSNPQSAERRYRVITESAIKLSGGMRFDCVPHREMTGPIAR